MIKIDFISDINEKFATSLGYPEVDRYMIKALWWHLAIFIVLVFTNSFLKIDGLQFPEKYPNPFGWRAINPTEGIYSLVLAFIAVLIPVLVKGKIKNHYIWRIIVTLAFLIFSYLFVFISGGSIEMHFHFFIVAALIVMYADWRLGWILLLFTGLHHGILNYIQPGWVYFYGRNDLAVISHAIPVLVMVIFTTAIAEIIRGGIMAIELTNLGVMAKLKEDKKLDDKE